MSIGFPVKLSILVHEEVTSVHITVGGGAVVVVEHHVEHSTRRQPLSLSQSVPVQAGQHHGTGPALVGMETLYTEHSPSSLQSKVFSRSKSEYSI